MADTTFIPGTVITSDWLNTVNDTMYSGGWYNILLDGVDSTGIVDATSLINTRITALAALGGGTIYFPAGTYLVKDIVLASNVNLVSTGNAVLLKNGGTDETHIMYGYGTTGTSTNLTADCTIGSDSCAVTSVSGFAEGDYVLIRTNEYVSMVYGRNVDIVKIKTIASLTVTFDRQVVSDYLVINAAEMVLLSPVENVQISGFDMQIPTVAGGNVGGHIDLQYGVNCLITKNKLSGSGGDAAIRFKTCYLSSVRFNSIHDGQNMSASGLGYGIEFDETTQFCEAAHNHTINVREDTFTNRTRFCSYNNNTCISHYDSGFNTHGAGVSHCTIHDNFISGTQTGYGISVGFGAHTGGDSWINIYSNTIKNCAGSGISINAPVGKENSYIFVSENNIYNVGVVGSGAHTGVAMTYTNNSQIKDNYINGVTTFASNGIYASNSTNLTVLNNTITNFPNGYGITVDTITNGYLQYNKMSSLVSYNVRGINTSTNVLVTDNYSDTTFYLGVSGMTSRNNSWNVFTGSATYDPGSLADGVGVTTTVTCTGAALGDAASATFSLDLQGITVSAWVSSVNTVSVRFQNESGGVLDLASGTLKVISQRI